MSRHRRRHSSEASSDLGFQIAPMIDVVFVVLVFFMSLCAAIKVEAELNTKLPGNATTIASVDFPDKQTTVIEVNGRSSSTTPRSTPPTTPTCRRSLIRSSASSKTPRTPRPSSSSPSPAIPGPPNSAPSTCSTPSPPPPSTTLPSPSTTDSDPRPPSLHE